MDKYLKRKEGGESANKTALMISLLLFSVAVSNVPYCQSLPPTGPYVYVLVWSQNWSYAELEPAVTTYKHDLENAGFSVEIRHYPDSPLTWDTNATIIRQFLQTEAGTYEIAGVLLVGDVPYANYEIGKETFPCDLYYMDLDGNWTDSDYDGVYDMHTNETGDLEPEIWVGRLYASTVTGDEVELLNNYFDKNHRFRIGNLTLPRRALAYIDNEFVYSAENANSSLGMIYGNEITLVTDPNTTSVTDYKNRLNDTLGYEWLHLAAHGNHEMHAFNTSQDGTYVWTYVFSSDIRNIDPHAFFYTIMACNTADYALTNYIGGSYIFADTYGLLVLGSTKLHYIWNVNDLYEPIGKGKCIGQAFKEWFEKYGESIRWSYYGLTILGDPTLQAPRVCDVTVTDVTASKSVVVQNSTIPINVTVENKGNFTETFDVTLYANTTFIGNMTVTNLQPLTTTILTFGWNTTGFAKGNYRISATAVLPLDNNPDDNTYTNGWVAVILKDDVAVTNVIPSNGRVVQNSTIPINVTVENKGNFTETFDVTLYANTTFIRNMTVTDLQPLTTTILTFGWNTTGFAKGNYRISATAVLPVDNDQSDNIYMDCWVAVILKYDVIVTGVTVGDSLYGEIEVHSGWNVSINVTVRNEGISVEAFNVTVYYDDEIIETQKVNLSSGADRILTFIWDTTGVSLGNYTISANASIVPGETYTTDNTYTDGWVKVRPLGDVNDDGKVSVADMVEVDIALGTQSGDPDHNPYADVNGDGNISVADMVEIDAHLGETC